MNIKLGCHAYLAKMRKQWCTLGCETCMRVTFAGMHSFITILSFSTAQLLLKQSPCVLPPETIHLFFHSRISNLLVTFIITSSFHFQLVCGLNAVITLSRPTCVRWVDLNLDCFLNATYTCAYLVSPTLTLRVHLEREYIDIRFAIINSSLAKRHFVFCGQANFAFSFSLSVVISKLMIIYICVYYPLLTFSNRNT